MRQNKRQKRAAQEAMQPADIRLQITEEEIPLHIQIHKVAMHMGLLPSDLAVYLALKYHADGTVQEDDVFPSHLRLAKLANVSDRTVIRSMATLVSKGMVKKTSTKKNGRYTVNHYLLLSPFRWADPELLKELSYKKPCDTEAPDHVTQSRNNKNQAFNKNQIQEPAAANLGCTSVIEAEPPDTPPPAPEENSLLHAFLDQEQFGPDQKQAVETFQQAHGLSEDQVYTVLLDLVEEGVHKDGLFYAMKETTRIGPTNVISYLYSVAKANPVGGPLNEPVRFYTEGRRDNSQSGQHVPTSKLPDAKTVYERIKDHKCKWDHRDVPGGIFYITKTAFDLKDMESNKIWFDSIWRELKNMRQKELTNEYSLREEVTFEAQG